MKYILVLLALYSFYLVASDGKEAAQKLADSQFPVCKSYYKFTQGPTYTRSKYRTQASSAYIEGVRDSGVTIKVTPQMAQEMAAWVNGDEPQSAKPKEKLQSPRSATRTIHVQPKGSGAAQAAKK